MGLGISIGVDGVPDDDLAGATRVEVQERVGEATTFRIEYAIGIEDGDLPRLVDDRFAPGRSLSIFVPLDSEIHCLVRGPVSGQEVHLAHGGAGSRMEIRGADTTSVMDRETKAAVWSDVTDSDVASRLLSAYGYITDVESTDSQHQEDEHALIQRESDLQLLRRLARRNGFQFWVTGDFAGVETAHFRRSALGEEPRVALVVNRDGANVESLDLSWDVERPTEIIGSQLDSGGLEEFEGSVAASSAIALGDSAFGDLAGATRSVHLAVPTDDVSDLRARGEAAVNEASWFLRATCRSTLDRLGTIVRAHTVGELIGAGTRYSGRYFVASVRHTIDASAHMMDIELVRNAWGS